MKKTLCTLLALALTFALASCGEKPDAPDAPTSQTPTEDKTPTDPQPTEGETEHTHTWIDAICTEPKTCSECGETEGEALGHDMRPATTEAPSTCSRCGYTEGEPLAEVVASGVCGENVTWMLTNTGLLTISGSGPMYDYGFDNLDQNMYYPPWFTDPRQYIKEAVIEDGVTSIGGFAFFYCDDLAVVSIPDSVTTVGKWAFYHCVNLTGITLPKNVTFIDFQAFYGCSKLSTFTIPKGVTELGRGVFTYCDAMEQIEVESGNEHFVTVDNVLFSADMSVLYLCPAKTISTEYSIPSSVTLIESGAFSECVSLTNVIIPDSVTEIGNDAFSACAGLTSVTIPGSVSTIGDTAFCLCAGLTSVTLSEGVEVIGTSAFSSCDNLKTVRLPSTLHGFGQNIFNGYDAITDVYFGGSQERWSNIERPLSVPSSATIHFGA